MGPVLVNHHTPPFGGPPGLSNDQHMIPPFHGEAGLGMYRSYLIMVGNFRETGK